MRRTTAAWVASLLLACGGASEAPPEYPRLPSGEAEGIEPVALAREPLRSDPIVVTQPSSSPLVTVRVAFDAGSADDEDGREGATLLAARLMTEGGAGDRDYAALSAALYPMAAEVSATVGRDQTVFVGQVHRDHLDAFYAIFADVLLRPRMSADDFERVRSQVQTELQVDLRSADVEALGQQALQALMYRSHPYAHPALGTSAGLSRLRVDDVRAQRARVFCAGRARVGIAGAYPDGFDERVARDVAQLTGDACQGRLTLPRPTTVRAPRVLLVDKPSSESVAVSMGFPTAVSRSHDDYAALTLVTSYLGQHRQFVGQLMQSIRGERGLNYGDYAYAEHFTQAPGTRFPRVNDARRQQYVSAWLRPLRPETAHFAIRLAVRELRRVYADGLTQEEFERIRTFTSAYFALYQQTPSRRLGYAIDQGFYGQTGNYVENLRGQWGALTLDQVNAAIRRHLDPAQLQIAIVTSEAEALADRLASEAPSPITYRSAVPEEVTTEDQEVMATELGIPRDRMEIIRVDAMFEE
ncbi:MAG: M16 family metallopeptidase [Sandaracinaceae bacterium]